MNIAGTCLLLVLLYACGASHHNELVYRFHREDGSIGLDSLKSLILSDSGTEMFASYPDSDVVIIQYDRYRTHQECIEDHFRSNGYRIELLRKTPVEEKAKPWEKRERQ